MPKHRVLIVEDEQDLAGLIKHTLERGGEAEAQIVGSGCPQNCSGFAEISEKAIPKSTLSQHFKALREAGLIRGERVGVEMRNTSRCAEIEKRFPGLIMAIVKAHNVQSAEEARGRRRKGRARH